MSLTPLIVSPGFCKAHLEGLTFFFERLGICDVKKTAQGDLIGNCNAFCWVHPGKLTLNMKNTCSKRKIIFQTLIYGFNLNQVGGFNDFLCSPRNLGKMNPI